jgi:pimeloyl-ACP methyl ester carboxylesterase
MRPLRWIGITVILSTVLLSLVFLRDMNRAYERVSERGTIIASPLGDIEFTQGGSGPEVLVIHGSGGGYDQGELIAEAVLGDNFHWITPSRFGYLRSTFHEGATWDDQAHAYAVLLDRLDIDTVAVVAMSQGGPSALLFAVLYPERVSSLTLISCGVTASTAEDQEEANEKGDTLVTIFEHDVLYWAAARFFKKQLMELIGASDKVVDGLTASQRELFERFIDEMNPVSLRSAGAAFDNRATMPGQRIAAITAPTLILHAVDDNLQLYHNAEFAARLIPNAKLVRFESGGHFVIGTEQAAIRAAVAAHILGHAPGSEREASAHEISKLSAELGL